jgi:hypothetical protein
MKKHSQIANIHYLTGRINCRTGKLTTVWLENSADGKNLPTNGEKSPPNGKNQLSDGKNIPPDGKNQPTNGENLPPDGEKTLRMAKTTTDGKNYC